MDPRIGKFFDEEKTMAFCTAENNVPHCVSCYYAWLHDYQVLIFKSARQSQHIANAMLNESVAGTITPGFAATTRIKGIQFTGKFFIPTGALLDKAKNKYYLKFPVALVIPGELWGVEVSSVKMIDNTLGFGKKLTWKRMKTEEREIAQPYP